MRTFTDSTILDESKTGSKFNGTEITFNDTNGKMVESSLLDNFTKFPEGMQNFLSTLLGIEKTKSSEPGLEM
ncbi:MAG: hypothetical protein FWE45_00380 [Firmicutes bacterium]|nr:hypothetical protein [Bacillota bacterium]